MQQIKAQHHFHTTTEQYADVWDHRLFFDTAHQFGFYFLQYTEKIVIPIKHDPINFMVKIMQPGFGKNIHQILPDG
jgi:hypothetical protein